MDVVIHARSEVILQCLGIKPKKPYCSNRFGLVIEDKKKLSRVPKKML